MSFNLSNPKSIQSNEKKVAWYEKVWAGLNLISLFGEGLIPKGVKDNISIKWRNIGILLTIAVLVYFIGCGLYYNAKLLMEATKHISFSLGDSFYYYGVFAILFTALQYFNLDKQVLDHADRKKIIKEAIKDIGKKNPVIKSIGNTLSRHKSISIFYSLSAVLNTLWVIWGIIFYDRWLFVSVVALSLIFTIAISPIKDLKYVRVILILEIIATMILVSFIVLNHFLIF